MADLVLDAILVDGEMNLYWLRSASDVSGTDGTERCNDHDDRNATVAIMTADEVGEVTFWCTQCWNSNKPEFVRYNRAN